MRNFKFGILASAGVIVFASAMIFSTTAFSADVKAKAKTASKSMPTNAANKQTLVTDNRSDAQKQLVPAGSNFVIEGTIPKISFNLVVSVIAFYSPDYVIQNAKKPASCDFGTDDFIRGSDQDIPVAIQASQTVSSYKLAIPLKAIRAGRCSYSFQSLYFNLEQPHASNVSAFFFQNIKMTRIGSKNLLLAENSLFCDFTNIYSGCQINDESKEPYAIPGNLSHMRLDLRDDASANNQDQGAPGELTPSDNYVDPGLFDPGKE